MNELTVFYSPITTREEADEVLRVVSLHSKALQVAMAKLDQSLTQTRAKHQPGIDRLDKAISDNKYTLEVWAEAHKEELFREKRSIDMLHGTIGFRSGNRELGLLARVNWDAVKKKLVGRLKKYLRVKTEVDKRRILMDTANDGPLKAGDLSALGLKVIQDEKFYLDLKENIGASLASSAPSPTPPH